MILFDDRSIPNEPDNLYIVPTKLAEAPNGGVAIARSYEVQLIDVANRKVVRDQPRDCPQKSKCVIRKSQTALAMSDPWMSG
ncbi:hypothetical protein pipiens_002171 [Culex pipiens pipiens]|uniref:Uncharacterized protein n=1 Tax=Culex pipiens pipiens TaxID=38569 RepID=A0ABD1DK15_CULPP